MQSVSPAFTTAAGATARTPVTKVEFKWDGENWTDESTYLASHSGSLSLAGPGDSLIAAGDVGTATIILANDTGRFAWKLTGALTAYIGGAVGLYGIEARISVGFGSEYVRIFTGVIYDWSESPDMARITLSLRDVGFTLLQDRGSTVVTLDQRSDAWIEELADLVGIASGSRLIDVGLHVIPYAWLDDESILEEMWLVAEADGGSCYFDQNGILRFENALHWLTHDTVLWAFDEGDYKVHAPVYAVDDVATKITTAWSARFVNEVMVIYELEELNKIAPGATFSFEARFNYPILALADIETEDYYAVSSGGQDLRDQITISVPTETLYGQRCTISITNSHTTLIAYIPFLQLKGIPLIGGPNQQVSEEAAVPAISFSRTRSARGNAYLQTYKQAKGLAQFLLARYENLVAEWTLQGAPGIPQLELGDRISFTHADTITGTIEGFVVGIDWNYSADLGFKQNIRVMDASTLFPRSDYFIIGVDELGGGKVCWY